VFLASLSIWTSLSPYPFVVDLVIFLQLCPRPGMLMIDNLKFWFYFKDGSN